MSEILIPVTAVLLLLAGLAALVVLARRDGFAGPGTGYLPHDELGPLSFRRRPV
ncbi:hypothetical protein [Marmoricola sp. RAF53]|uniref:hypothetical protein n=1 Tax=Marmoricola sp. RAF53 TaxID=3233059 RepID=UPI003F9E4E35